MEFVKCTFEDNNFLWPLVNSTSRVSFVACNFDHQTLKLPKNNLIGENFKTCVFAECELAEIIFEGDNYKNTSFSGCWGYIIIGEGVSDAKLKPFEVKAPILYYKKHELYIIPQETWTACDKDYGQFLIIITK